MLGRVLVIAGMLTLLLVSGLPAAMSMGNAATTVTVNIPSGAGQSNGAPGYSPDSITVVIGVNNTVTWTNGDTVAHTVTSDNVSAAGKPFFDSGSIAAGANYNFTFTSPGRYTYHCNYHSWMTGSVTVLASTTPAPEFPTAWLAVILFAAIAAVMVAAPRLRGAAGLPVRRTSPP